MLNHNNEWMSGWNHGAFGQWVIVAIAVGVLLILFITLRPKK
jgi:hypothetical protein